MKDNCRQEVMENLGAFSGPVPNGISIGLDVTTSTVYVRGPKNQWVVLTTSGGGGGGGQITQVIASIGVTLDGGGSIITTGQKGYVVIPYNATITGWSIISREIGYATFDVWKRSGGKPTVVNTITGGSKPTLAASDYATSSSVSGWTNSISAGDIIGWNLDSVATSTWVLLELFVNKI